MTLVRGNESSPPVEEDIHQVAQRSRRLIRHPPASCKRGREPFQRTAALGQRAETRVQPRSGSAGGGAGRWQVPGAAERRRSGLEESAMRSPRKEESRRGGDGLAMGTGETSGVTARVAGVCVACGRAACVVWELWEGEGEVLAGGGCRGGVAAPAACASPLA